MADGRKNNGGHSTKGRAGRKPKSEELKVSAYAINAIEKQFGSQDAFFADIAKKAQDGSRDHFKALIEYAYGKPQEKVDHTTGGDRIQGSPIMLNNPKGEQPESK